MSAIQTIPQDRAAEPVEALRLYSVERVAQLANCCTETLLRRIRRGHLQARRIGRGYGIPHSQVVELLTGARVEGGSR